MIRCQPVLDERARLSRTQRLELDECGVGKLSGQQPSELAVENGCNHPDARGQRVGEPREIARRVASRQLVETVEKQEQLAAAGAFE